MQGKKTEINGLPGDHATRQPRAAQGGYDPTASGARRE